MTVYYVQNGNVTAPPKVFLFAFVDFKIPVLTGPSQGFRMITGNAMLRSTNTKAPPKITSFRCFGVNGSDPNSATGYPQPPGGGVDTVELPTTYCAGGIRAQTYFPQ